MGQDNPVTEDEWESFRFPLRAPRRPVQSPTAQSEEESDEGESGDGDEGLPYLDAPPLPEWEYCAKTGFLKNVGLSKKINLEHLNEATKISRTLAVFSMRPDLAFPSLEKALKKASQDRFGMPLDQLLKEYADGRVIVWNRPPGPTP